MQYKISFFKIAQINFIAQFYSIILPGQVAGEISKLYIQKKGTKKNEKYGESIFIDKILGEYEPQIFFAFIGKIKGQYITNTVIKIEPTEWQLPISDRKGTKSMLAENLYRLPPSFSINVDPEDLL